MLDDLQEILFTEKQIQERVGALGREISGLYEPDEVLAVIAIINGAILFTADLIRHISLPLLIDCVRASSYRTASSPSGEPEVIDIIRIDIKDRHVLLLDDILDTGHTLTKVTQLLRNMHPASLRTCVLLDKKGRRQVPFEADLVGFTVPDAFVVGYGLDFAERYRNLPCIGILKEEEKQQK